MIPERIDWDEIKDLYDRAKQCLWCPRRTSGWQRDEQNGMFYLWSAYHYAGVKSTEKNAVDHKLYARILAMMNHELMYQVTYAYGWYNNQRPHSHNGGIPPAKVA